MKRSMPFLHYSCKWKTSRCTVMSHILGSQPGNSWLRSSKVPESKGKRLRRFVQSSPDSTDQSVQIRGRGPVRPPQALGVLTLPNARCALHLADRPTSQQPHDSETSSADARPGKRPRLAIPSATLAATSGSPGQALAIPLL